MNRHDNKLEHEIVWDESGHLSEVAKFALADGQDAILPPDALDHFSLCQPCMQSVGEAALLSAQMSAALGGERAEQRSFPWIPIAAGLTVAVLSTFPRLSMVHDWLVTTGSFVAHMLRLLGHALIDASARGLAPSFYLASTCLLLTMGFAVAWLMPPMSAQVVRGKGFSS